MNGVVWRDRGQSGTVHPEPTRIDGRVFGGTVGPSAIGWFIREDVSACDGRAKASRAYACTPVVAVRGLCGERDRGPMDR